MLHWVHQNPPCVLVELGRATGVGPQVQHRAHVPVVRRGVVPDERRAAQDARAPRGLVNANLGADDGASGPRDLNCGHELRAQGAQILRLPEAQVVDGHEPKRHALGQSGASRVRERRLRLPRRAKRVPIAGVLEPRWCVVEGERDESSSQLCEGSQLRDEARTVRLRAVMQRCPRRHGKADGHTGSAARRNELPEFPQSRLGIVLAPARETIGVVLGGVHVRVESEFPEALNGPQAVDVGPRLPVEALNDPAVVKAHALRGRGALRARRRT